MEENNLDEKVWPPLASKVVHNKIHDYKLFKKIEELRDSFETALINAKRDPDLAPMYCSSGRDAVFLDWSEVTYQGIFLYGEIDKPFKKILTPWGSVPLFYRLFIGSPNATEEEREKIKKILNDAVLKRVKVSSPRKDEIHILCALTKIDNLTLPQAKLYESYQNLISKEARSDAWFELQDKYSQEKKLEQKK